MTKIWAVKNSDGSTVVIFCDDKPKKVTELNEQKFYWTGLNEIARAELPIDMGKDEVVELSLVHKAKKKEK